MKTILSIAGYAIIFIIFDISRLIQGVSMACNKTEQLRQAEEDFFLICSLRDKAKKGSAEWLRHSKSLKHKITEIQQLKKELGRS
jgi:hypothetical protein